MNTKKLAIGVHVNENTMRTPNPHVPWTAGEIARDAAECRDEGAAVMHYHARTANGEPDHSAEAYAAIASAVRARCDILLAPSMANAPGNTVGQRLANITGTADDPLTRPDFLVMDMGCANMDLFDPDTRSFRSDDRVFVNSTATHCELFRISGNLGLKPYLASFTIGWTRAVAAYLDMKLVDRPAPLALILGGPEFLGTHPCTVEGLRAHLPFLPPGTEWIVSSYRGNVLDVAAIAIELGGHIAIGTGDYHHAELGFPGNAELVRRVRRLAEAAGREVATPDEARRLFGMAPRTTAQ